MSFTITSLDTPDGANEEGTSVKASRYDALIGERSKRYELDLKFERLPYQCVTVLFCFVLPVMALARAAPGRLQVETRQRGATEGDLALALFQDTDN